MLQLLRQGFFYVSDITKYYEFLTSWNCVEKSELAEKIRPLLEIDECAFLHSDLFSHELIKIRIPIGLKRSMEEKGIKTYEELVDNIKSFGANYRKDIQDIINVVQSYFEDEDNEEDEVLSDAMTSEEIALMILADNLQKENHDYYIHDYVDEDE